MKTSLPVVTASPELLPPLYARWFDEFIHAQIPAETEATCDNCAMCPDAGSNESGRFYFRAETKCCTYLPELANFLVGNVLDGTPGPGRTSVQARIENGVGVSPLGLMQSESFKLLSANTIHGFGNSQSLRCPHYLEESGHCGVWEHREATCATWFCKHVRGVTAKRFWNRLLQLFKAVETGLARHCLVELDLGDEAIAFIFPVRSVRDARRSLDASEIDGGYDPYAYRAMWGNWAGKELDFYRACGSLVRPLSWSDVLTVAGPDARLFAKVAKESFVSLVDPTLPTHLTVGNFQVLGMNSEVCRVQSYSFLDPLDLPRPMFEALSSFDGRAVELATREASARMGEAFPEEAVRKLVDFEILVPVAARD